VLFRYSRYLTTRTLSVERFQVRLRLVGPVAVTASRVGLVGGFLSRGRRGDLAGANVRTTADDFAVDEP
jgi:hypothetical protein